MSIFKTEIQFYKPESFVNLLLRTSSTSKTSLTKKSKEKLFGKLDPDYSQLLNS